MWEQLVYTSVDEVVDGKTISGWHVKERSDGLTQEQVETLLTLVRQVLVPVTPLDPFPTNDEVWNADRRLSQFMTPWGTALIQTALAGVDATGRPNTFTHALLETADQPAPNRHLVDFWRAPWWLTPFGHQAVKEASLPSPDEIGPGSSITDDVVAEFFSDPERLNALGALVEAVAENKVEKADGSPRKTVVVPVLSSEEAALWVAGLSRLTAPRLSREISWSTIERVQHQIDVEGLVQRGLDIAFVPEDDLHGKQLPEGLIQIVPSKLVEPSVPRTSWGALTAGALRSSQDLQEAIEGIQDLMEELDDQRGISFSWPLAMAEACDRGLLKASEVAGQAKRQKEWVDHELLTCTSDAWERSPYLSDVVRAQFGNESWSALQWHEVLSSVGDVTQMNKLLLSSTERYLSAAASDAAWLSRPSAASRGVRECVSAWSSIASDSRLVELIDQGRQTLGESLGTYALLAATESFVREGMSVPEIHWDRLIDELIQTRDGRVVGLHPALLQSSSAVVHSHVLYAVESQMVPHSHRGVLEDDVLELPLPLNEADLVWLGSGPDIRSAPVVAAAFHLHQWRLSKAAPMKRRLLASLSALPIRYRLSESILAELLPNLLPSDLQSFGLLEETAWERLAFDYMLSTYGSDRTVEFARNYLDASRSRAGAGSPEAERLHALAVITVLSKYLTGTGRDYPDAATEEQVRKVLAMPVREVESGVDLPRALHDDCAALELRLSARRLLAVWSGRQSVQSRVSTKDKQRLQQLASMAPSDLAGTLRIQTGEVSEDFLRACSALYRSDTQAARAESAHDPLSWLSADPNVPAGHPHAGHQTAEGPPSPGNGEVVRNIVRAQFANIPANDRDVLWRRITTQISSEDADEWLSELLGLAPSRGIRLPWGKRSWKEKWTK